MLLELVELVQSVHRYESGQREIPDLADEVPCGTAGFWAGDVAACDRQEVFGLDTGDILLQKEVALEPQDTAETLGPRLATIGADLMERYEFDSEGDRLTSARASVSLELAAAAMSYRH